MKTSDLIFVGIKGSVVALYRDSGQQAWATRLKGMASAAGASAAAGV